MRQSLAAFAAGALFSVGLGIGGMTRPVKIHGFLDVAGAWDPSLLFVMAGAVAVSFAAFRTVRRPRLAPALERPRAAGITPRLVGGAAVFGVGWGLSGLCPGPAVTALASGLAPVAVFVASMAAGLWLADPLARREPAAPERATPTGERAGEPAAEPGG